GMGFAGLLNLQRFLDGGGVLIAAAGSGRLLVDGGLVRGVSEAGFNRANASGSVLRAKVLRPEHPLAYGYPELTHVFLGGSPGFDVPKSQRGRVVMQFGTRKPEGEEDEKKEEKKPASGIEVEDLEAPPPPAAPVAVPTGSKEEKREEKKKDDDRFVLSGLVKNESEVNGKPAILDLPVGKGRVILFAFNPLYRYLNLSDFRFLYNALLNWNDLPR
ncbi:MAG TPA: hypothetical protein VLV54_03875, partial [Thermoanaerobaculia bacterium]|nr:hypothetical protein [Thermoanaerobaculia bacterium]